jgi:hypothetical protein
VNFRKLSFAGAVAKADVGRIDTNSSFRIWKICQRPRWGVLSGKSGAHRPPLAAVRAGSLKARSPGSSPDIVTKSQ